jgi:hypothetical protein
VHSRRAVPTHRSAYAFARGACGGSSPPPRPRRPERCRARSCTWYPGRGSGTGTTRRLFRVDHEVTGAWVTHAPLGCRVTPRTRPRRVDTSMQKNTYTWRSRSPGLGHQPDRPVRCRSGDRRHRDRRRAPGVPVRGQGPLRLLERHRPRRGVLRGSQQRSTGCRCAATGGSITPSKWLRSARSGASAATAVPSMRGRWPRARRTRGRCRHSSTGSATPSGRAGSRCLAGHCLPKSPGGQPGNHSASRAAGSHPAHRHFGEATPGLAATIRPVATAGRAQSLPNRTRQRPAGRPAAASKKPRPAT